MEEQHKDGKSGAVTYSRKTRLSELPICRDSHLNKGEMKNIVIESRAEVQRMEEMPIETNLRDNEMDHKGSHAV